MAKYKVSSPRFRDGLPVEIESWSHSAAAQTFAEQYYHLGDIVPDNGSGIIVAVENEHGSYEFVRVKATVHINYSTDIVDEWDFEDVNMERFKCTDPDRNQYGCRLGTHAFMFREMDVNGCWQTDIINLSKYTVKEIDEYISGYYSSMKELVNIYKDEDELRWIIAECIFEQKSGLY